MMNEITLREFAVEAPGMKPAARSAIEYVFYAREAMNSEGVQGPINTTFVVPEEIAHEFKRYHFETARFLRERGLYDEWRAHLKLKGY